MQSRKPQLLTSLIERVHSSPMRLTKKRERILGALLTMERPASAIEIRARAGLPDSDLVTVYRSLEAFASLGILQRVPLESGTHLFEITAPDDHFHHLICRRCLRTERLDVCLGSELETRARERGFTRVSHVIEVYGLCAECSSKN